MKWRACLFIHQGKMWKLWTRHMVSGSLPSSTESAWDPPPLFLRVMYPQRVACPWGLSTLFHWSLDQMATFPQRYFISNLYQNHALVCFHISFDSESRSSLESKLNFELQQKGFIEIRKDTKYDSQFHN